MAETAEEATNFEEASYTIKYQKRHTIHDG
jgi:hypothetical protein